MPIMDGLEATRKIREFERQRNPARHTPIVGLSGHARGEHVDAALTSGMDDYVTKPYQEEQIRQKLAQHVRSGGLQASRSSC